MPLLTWTDTYSVKVKTFDSQHQRLFSMMNDLHEAMRNGKGSLLIGRILGDLLEYTCNHFAAEEKVMERVAYPALASHRAEHNALTAKVRDFAREFNAGRAALSPALMQFLQDWLKKHIQGTDQKYSAFLNARGVN